MIGYPPSLPQYLLGCESADDAWSWSKALAAHIAFADGKHAETDVSPAMARGRWHRSTSGGSPVGAAVAPDEGTAAWAQSEARARCIQAVARGTLARREITKQTKAASAVQLAVRAHLARLGRKAGDARGGSSLGPAEEVRLVSPAESGAVSPARGQVEPDIATAAAEAGAMEAALKEGGGSGSPCEAVAKATPVETASAASHSAAETPALTADDFLVARELGRGFFGQVRARPPTWRAARRVRRCTRSRPLQKLQSARHRVWVVYSVWGVHSVWGWPRAVPHSVGDATWRGTLPHNCHASASYGAYAAQVLLVRRRQAPQYLMAPLAMKVLDKQALLARNLVFVRRLQDELACLMLPPAPFVARLVEAFHDAQHVYLVMDCLPGGDLKAFLRRNGALDVERSRLYAAQVSPRGHAPLLTRPSSVPWWLTRLHAARCVPLGWCRIGEDVPSGLPRLCPQTLVCARDGRW